MEEEIDLKEIISYIFRKRKILVCIMIVAILIGMMYTFLIKTPMYQSQAKIFIDKTDIPVEQIIASNDLKQEGITAKYDKQTKIIEVICEKKDKEDSINTINEYVEKLQKELEEKYEQKTFQVIETPKMPEIPSNRSYAKDIFITTFIGLLIGMGYIMIRISLRGVTDIYQIEDKLGIKALGEIDAEKIKVDKKNNKRHIINTGKIAEQIKRIQAEIMINKEDKKQKVILLTATKKGEGTSYIVANLAKQFGKLYKKVLIIDADIKEKTLTKKLAKDSQGLTDVIKSQKIETISEYIEETKIENVSILPSGIEKIEEELFLKETAREIIEKLKTQYDMILIDSKSINEDIIPISLANIADEAIIIAEKEKTKEDAIIKAKREIEKSRGRISGIILNKANIK